MVSVHYKADDGYLKVLGKLSQRIGKHGVRSAKGIPCLGIKHGYVAVLYYPAKLANECYVVCELALANTADVPQKPLALNEAVDCDDVVRAGGKGRDGRDLEVNKCIVIAKKKIGRLNSVHTDFRYLGFVAPYIWKAQQPRYGPKIAFGWPRMLQHIKSLEIALSHICLCPFCYLVQYNIH